MFKITEQLKSCPLEWAEKLIRQYPQAKIYLVGGAVRDILLNRPTDDFDFVVTNVPPENLEEFLNKEGKVDLVGKSFGIYKFRPIIDQATKQITEKELDIALPRTEHSFNTGGYKDVAVTSNYQLDIIDDLKRRDFTINALAIQIVCENNQLCEQLIDQFNGQTDLGKKIIRTVGTAEERFQEDASRMIRAIRFACQLNFSLTPEIITTIKEKNNLIAKLAPERIQTELDKIMMSDQAEHGFRLMQELGILKVIIPELEQCVGVEQSRNHIYEVFEHSVRALGFAVKNNQSLEMRWAALLHDVGKAPTRVKQGDIFTFYNHENAGAKLAERILKRFRYPEKTTKKIVHLVYHHMFYYNIGEITDSAVRRLINKVGPDNIDDLINLRICDRLGMGRPKGKPFKLIELERRVKEVSLDPLSVKMLKINGEDIMKQLAITPGPRIGLLLNALLNEVLEKPELNTPEQLINQIKELNKLTDQELNKLAPNLAEHEEKRREQLIGKPLVFKGQSLKRLVRKIKNKS